MCKTAIQSLIQDLNKSQDEFSRLGVIKMLEYYLKLEEAQVISAFEEGVKYGNSELQTFDYPASRYFNFTYKKLNK